MNVLNVERFDGDNMDYHASPGVSNSKLSDFLEDPRIYYARHVEKSVPREEATYFDMGTLTHEQVLMGYFESQCIEIPASVLSKSGSKAGGEWQKFVADNPRPAILLKTEELMLIKAMSRAVFAHEQAEALVVLSEHEVNYRGIDEATGLPVRCRVDMNSKRFFADLKTTKNSQPQSFASSCASYGYHRQIKFYGDILRGQEGGETKKHAIIAVSKTNPVIVRVYDLSQKFIDLGAAEIDDGLARLAECHETDIWRTMADNEAITLDPPRWAEYEDDYAISEN